jgi:hypothetical protein
MRCGGTPKEPGSDEEDRPGGRDTENRCRDGTERDPKIGARDLVLKRAGRPTDGFGDPPPS